MVLAIGSAPKAYKDTSLTPKYQGVGILGLGTGLVKKAVFGQRLVCSHYNPMAQPSIQSSDFYFTKFLLDFTGQFEL